MEKMKRQDHNKKRTGENCFVIRMETVWAAHVICSQTHSTALPGHCRVYFENDQYFDILYQTPYNIP